MEFKNKYAFLSNMYSCNIVFKGVKFKSAETLYQMFKCKNIEDMNQFVKLDGYQAKKLGKTVELRPDWNKVKLDYMQFILRLKFDQNPVLKEKLKLVTEPIVEDNHWRDAYWGVYKGQGQNHLGRLLEMLRDEYSGTPRTP